MIINARSFVHNCVITCLLDRTIQNSTTVMFQVPPQLEHFTQARLEIQADPIIEFLCVSRNNCVLLAYTALFTLKLCKVHHHIPGDITGR